MTPSLRDNASCDLLRFHRTVLELLAALLLSFFSAPPARGAAPPAPRRPNVILISVDSLRPDHLGS
ncbi:MAG TPA: hypothetical protein P5079_11030, partial [Elusimicrobiota bacterium]|nr:hypothetical protein [Elusimicrobiota bacterium]